MPALLIRHQVADYATWQSVFDADAPTRRAHGCQGERRFRNSADGHEVLLLLDWDDLDRARFFLQSDEVQEGWTRGGVTGEPDIWYLADADPAHDEPTAPAGRGR